jgi:Protein of unknown function (DUF1488)
MPLTPDPSGTFQVDGFVGVKFAMFDGQIRVLCLATWESLQDRAALDGTDQRDLAGTFERHRGAIEAVASNHYDRGEADPLIRSGEF